LAHKAGAAQNFAYDDRSKKCRGGKPETVIFAEAAPLLSVSAVSIQKNPIALAFKSFALTDMNDVACRCAAAGHKDWRGA
jgi:hypothetical protein